MGDEHDTFGAAKSSSCSLTRSGNAGSLARMSIRVAAMSQKEDWNAC
jgi:hypothetical protein